MSAHRPVVARSRPVGRGGHRVSDLGGRLLDRSPRLVAAGRVRDLGRGRIRLLLLSGLPFRGPDPSAQPGAADLPLGLGQPDPPAPGAARLPAHPTAVDHRVAVDHPGRRPGPLDLSDAGGRGAVRRRRQPADRRGRSTRGRGHDRRPVPGRVCPAADHALRGLGGLPAAVRARGRRRVRRPGALVTRTPGLDRRDRRRLLLRRPLPQRLFRRPGPLRCAGHLPRLPGVPGAARLDHGAPRPEPAGRAGQDVALRPSSR